MKFISGRGNCHLAGLNSYVISNRVDDQRGMVRVFHNTEDCLRGLKDSENRYCLAPHNHRQDITLVALKGKAFNVSFRWDNRLHPFDHKEWIFRSGILSDEISAHYHNCGNLIVTDIQPITDGGTFLLWSDIHTVVAEPGAAWLVNEGQVAPPSFKSLCYTDHSPFVLSMDGLYGELDRSTLDWAESEIGVAA